MRLNERCTALVAVLTLLLLLDSSWAQKYPDKPPKKQKPISDPHYRYQKQHDEYYGGYGGYAGYGQQHGGYRQPYSGGYKQPYPSSKQPYKQDPYKQDYYKGSYKQPDYYRDGYDSYDSYGSYGKKKKYKKEKDEPTLSTMVEFTVDQCSLRYPGVGLDTTQEPGSLTNDTSLNEFLSRPSTVAGWWHMGCTPSSNMHKHRKGYGDYDKDYYGEEYSSGSYNDTYSGDYGNGVSTTKVDDVGSCWYKGIADWGIRYKNDTHEDLMGTFITFICTLDPVKARRCDPGFNTVDGHGEVYIGGHGRVGITHNVAAGESTFDIANNKEPNELLITGFYNGLADEDHPNLPLTRYNVGLVTTLKLTGCTDINYPSPGDENTELTSVNMATAGMGSKFKVELTT